MTRITYWSNSKFSKWLKTKFGIPVPNFLTMSEWEKYNKTYENHFIFKFTKWLNKFQKFIYYPYDLFFDIKWYLKNRFFYKTHLIDFKLPKGKWYEYDERILYANFELLVDFLENDKTIKFLNEEIEYDYQQKQYSIIQKELYNWWKNERPNRIDPYSITKKECFEIAKKYSEKYKIKEIYNGYEKFALEEYYNEEDQYMLEKLISIRRSLWV